MNKILSISISVAALAVAGCACWLLLTVRAAVDENRETIASVAWNLKTASWNAAMVSSKVDTIVASLSDGKSGILPDLKSTAQSLKEAVASFTKLTESTTSLEKTIEGQIPRIGDSVVKVSGIRDDLKPTIDSVKPLLDEAQKIEANLQPVLKNTSEITSHIADTLPQFTDCAYYDEAGVPIGGNPDCVFNRFQGTSKAIETAMQSVAKATPSLLDSQERIAKAAAGIVEDAHVVTSRFVAPKTPTQKAWEMLKAGSGLWLLFAK